MLSFLADENFNNDIVRGVRRRNPGIMILRAQDVGLSGAGDPEVLEWSAANALAVLTHDVATMTKYAHDRIAAGKSLPGVFEVRRSVPIGIAIEHIALVAACSLYGEWEGRVIYLPLR
ncbi:hypothetical protein EBR56_06250 [bacterium]|nr:hypothetical protein [bacterium]